MPDPAALGAGGGTPLTASEWRDAARAVAVARRAGAAAVSVRHLTFHLSTLDFHAGQTHAHGHHAHGPARATARGRGSPLALASIALGGIAPALRQLPRCLHHQPPLLLLMLHNVQLLMLLPARLRQRARRLPDRVGGCVAQPSTSGDAWLCAAPFTCCATLQLLLLCNVIFPCSVL